MYHMYIYIIFSLSLIMGIQTNRKTYVMIAMYINVILMYNRWLINPYKPVGWRLGFAPFFCPNTIMVTAMRDWLDYINSL